MIIIVSTAMLSNSYAQLGGLSKKINKLTNKVSDKFDSVIEDVTGERQKNTDEILPSRLNARKDKPELAKTVEDILKKRYFNDGRTPIETYIISEWTTRRNDFGVVLGRVCMGFSIVKEADETFRLYDFSAFQEFDGRDYTVLSAQLSRYGTQKRLGYPIFYTIEGEEIAESNPSEE